MNCYNQLPFQINRHRGSGGMFDSRDLEAFVHDDQRKSIEDAPSFEKSMKSRYISSPTVKKGNGLKSAIWSCWSTASEVDSL